ncbi:MAG: hypothetical protein JXA96_14260 [Sedimentisphaerales bacterium]|nr:hypothetical protein [Sedimentisphaerales bacterium]
MAKSQKQEQTNDKPDGAAIISGIETDALSEERQIIEEAQKQIDEKIKFNTKKVESIIKEAEEAALEQAEQAKKKIMSSLRLELQRRSLNIRNEVMKNIQKNVESKFNLMLADDSYKAILQNWIIEAAIGLDAQSAVINASEKEMPLISDRMISEVVEKVNQKTGKQVSLKLSDKPPLSFQGVVLTSDNGHMAYNNQVKTRILRKEREIRMAIYNALFTDKRKD